MRLICPNCDAQYEVPDEVMPPEGRDVQCSNCGQTWFQDHPDAVAEAEATELSAPRPDEEVVQTAPEAPAAQLPDPPVQDPPAVPDVPTFEPGSDTDNAPDEPAPDQPARRRVDPAVARVLQEEAEIEAQARRNEMAETLESQPDLGLPQTDNSDEAARRAEESRDRMARMRGETAADDDTMPEAAAAAGMTAAAAGSRRDLLPDIEEINSTLRSNNDRNPGSDPGQTAQAEVREKRSSRRGFVLVIAIVALMALVYVYAPQIAEAVPQLADALQTYVAMIDSWRTWLDTKLEATLSWLDAVAVSSSQ
ncbi:zinc-ribbon domain-containing protein [uncultured Roseobacter sp.]|uniref:zinc-ribbon domain-containing protein n=1 Tax=uncultured Roseobacter sp. TaxID=114847 RepID=UPI002615F066|nr:zinc-ribbon domain-containing protein [uncultured Roseobacter sp.]